MSEDWIVPGIIFGTIAGIMLLVGGGVWLDAWSNEKARVQCDKLCGATGVMVLTTHGDCVCRERR